MGTVAGDREQQEKQKKGQRNSSNPFSVPKPVLCPPTPNILCPQTRFPVESSLSLAEFTAAAATECWMQTFHLEIAFAANMDAVHFAKTVIAGFEEFPQSFQFH